MRPISAAQHNSVVSLLNKGYSHCQIQARTGLGKGTVGRISKEVEENKENHPGGHPSKLSTHDKQSIVHQITTGKLDNAVQATQFINSIIPDPVSSQTVCYDFELLSDSSLYSCLVLGKLSIVYSRYTRF